MPRVWFNMSVLRSYLLGLIVAHMAWLFSLTTRREFGDPQLVLPFSSEIDLLMYSTFAVQSGESARQQRLALVLSYVLWWSIGKRSHLENAKGWTTPASCRVVGRTR